MNKLQILQKFNMPKLKHTEINNCLTFSGMISLFKSLDAYVALEPTPDVPIPPKLPTYF